MAEPPYESPTPVDTYAVFTDGLPQRLLRDLSFWGLTATQFLGAFNDNVFKQLILLLATPDAASGSSAGGSGVDLQAWGLLCFAAPFLLFSSVAGYVSEIRSKRTIIILCKVAEIFVMLLGVAAFYFYNVTGLPGLLAVLFLMGAQSAMFGPGKYGILPEMLRPANLPMGNGVILMTTFIAIIGGVAVAGLLKLQFESQLHVAVGVCVLIGIAGTLTSLLVRKTPPAEPDLVFNLAAVTAPADVRKLLREDGPLRAAILASCMFWLIGGLVQPAVNSLAKVQLGVNDLFASLMAASVAAGIAVGCLLAGLVSKKRVNFTVMRAGAWCIFICLALLAVPGISWEPAASVDGPRANLLGYYGSLVALIVLGIGTGMFSVPLQVFIQARPPMNLKGRTIAAMNFSNWIAITGAALLYFAFDYSLNLMDWPRSTLFAYAAALMLPMAIFYRPSSEDL